MTALVYALSDGMVIAKRNIIKIKRIPDVLVFVADQPDHVRPAVGVRVRRVDRRTPPVPDGIPEEQRRRE